MEELVPATLFEGAALARQARRRIGDITRRTHAEICPGNLNSSRAVLGNDVAIRAYRAGTIPFPGGTIIAALHYHHVPSEENNKIYGQEQSFVRGPPTSTHLDGSFLKRLYCRRFRARGGSERLG